jgi:hypothetical protein
MARPSRPKHRAPYGTYDVDQGTIEQYAVLAPSLSDYYPLPEVLPLHHPLLQQLSGTYPVQDAPAPWWPLCVAQVDPLLRPLLAGLSVEEYRQGTIAEERWRAFKQDHEDAWPARLPKSPKITRLLEATDWASLFTNRGPAETPHDLDLVVSTHPAYFINMSNGAGWTSCQHYRKGGDSCCLPGNFYDTGVAVTMLLPRGADVWEPGCVLARTTLRAFVDDDGCDIAAIGQVYHNNHTSALWLLAHLARLLDERGCDWSVVSSTNTANYALSSQLGETLRRRAGPHATVYGMPFWLPYEWFPPYLDGELEIDERREPWYSIKGTILPYGRDSELLELV